MNDPTFFGYPIKRFQWKDLHGKTLKMLTSSDGPMTLTGGVDAETGVIYILHDEIDEKKMTVTWYRPLRYRKAGGADSWRDGRAFNWEKDKDFFYRMKEFDFYGWETMEAPA